MCGEDGTQRVIYKLKEEYAKGGLEQKKRKEKERLKKKKNMKSKRTVSITRENPIVVPVLSLQYT